MNDEPTTLFERFLITPPLNRYWERQEDRPIKLLGGSTNFVNLFWIVSSIALSLIIGYFIVSTDNYFQNTKCILAIIIFCPLWFLLCIMKKLIYLNDQNLRTQLALTPINAEQFILHQIRIPLFCAILPAVVSVFMILTFRIFEAYSINQGSTNFDFFAILLFNYFIASHLLLNYVLCFSYLICCLLYMIINFYEKNKTVYLISSLFIPVIFIIFLSFGFSLSISIVQGFIFGVLFFIFDEYLLFEEVSFKSISILIASFMIITFCIVATAYTVLNTFYNPLKPWRKFCDAYFLFDEEDRKSIGHI